MSLTRAVNENDVGLCRKIMENSEGKGNLDETAKVPFLTAARNCQLDICRLMIENVCNKNPALERTLPCAFQTPLHMAATKGHFEICRLIIENVQDKNPADFYLDTPLHRAAKKGHTEICRLILANLKDKNPVVDAFGRTPLDHAKWMGHLDVIKIFEDNFIYAWIMLLPFK